ncbi:hypothetical protein Patl1_24379 [Pistacia atlantica]|uniref:Uncharacterized protein n=1 Tax=Pistacia atlantica TaxID=434234 RepID=A0ACC0ZZV5_9ROSI|nr:hypothetical protein Patl1_24379 [Pistacia atlantica]
MSLIPPDRQSRPTSTTRRGEESILPVQTLISVLDACHNLSGFPWWVIIATSTWAFRLSLLPVVILQLLKLRKIGELSLK